jgi:ubiquinone/menaquinone biosynthesis C-methylase UbiE
LKSVLATRRTPLGGATDGEARLSNLHEAKARKWFDVWAESWTFRRLRPWLRYVQRQVLDRIDWSQVTAVLDVACGTGWATMEAARSMQGVDAGMACGCDISTGMLAWRTNEEEGDAEAYFSAASAQALPFRGDSFDIVICTAAFHHFPAPLAALQELKRVLRSGGTLLLADSCRDQSVGTSVWDRLHRWFEPGHVKYYSREELVGLLDAAGFSDLEVTRLVPPFWQTKKLSRHVALFRATSS